MDIDDHSSPPSPMLSHRRVYLDALLETWNEFDPVTYWALYDCLVARADLPPPEPAPVIALELDLDLSQVTVERGVSLTLQPGINNFRVDAIPAASVGSIRLEGADQLLAPAVVVLDRVCPVRVRANRLSPERAFHSVLGDIYMNIPALEEKYAHQGWEKRKDLEGAVLSVVSAAETRCTLELVLVYSYAVHQEEGFGHLVEASKVTPGLKEGNIASAAIMPCKCPSIDVRIINGPRPQLATSDQVTCATSPDSAPTATQGKVARRRIPIQEQIRLARARSERASANPSQLELGPSVRSTGPLSPGMNKDSHNTPPSSSSSGPSKTTAAGLSHLPEEIVVKILQFFLIRNPRPSHGLAVLSRVSRCWTGPCQSCLYPAPSPGHIPGGPSKKFPLLLNTLASKPHLAEMVKDLGDLWTWSCNWVRIGNSCLYSDPDFSARTTSPEVISDWGISLIEHCPNLTVLSLPFFLPQHKRSLYNAIFGLAHLEKFYAKNSPKEDLLGSAGGVWDFRDIVSLFAQGRLATLRELRLEGVDEYDGMAKSRTIYRKGKSLSCWSGPEHEDGWDWMTREMVAPATALTELVIESMPIARESLCMFISFFKHSLSNLVFIRCDVISGATEDMVSDVLQATDPSVLRTLKCLEFGRGTQPDEPDLILAIASHYARVGSPHDVGAGDRDPSDGGEHIALSTLVLSGLVTVNIRDVGFRMIGQVLPNLKVLNVQGPGFRGIQLSMDQIFQCVLEWRCGGLLELVLSSFSREDGAVAAAHDLEEACRSLGTRTRISFISL